MVSPLGLSSFETRQRVAHAISILFNAINSLLFHFFVIPFNTLVPPLDFAVSVKL